VRREIASRLFPLPGHLRGRSAGAADSFIQSAGRFLTEVVAVPKPLADYRFHAANGFAASRPTVQSLTTAYAAFEAVFHTVRAFVQAEFDDDVAARLRLEDLDVYWETLLALYIYKGRPANGVAGYSPREILTHVSNFRRRVVWNILINTPERAGRAVVTHWWGIARWKRLSRPITRMIGMR
jgi:hypothetical protein